MDEYEISEGQVTELQKAFIELRQLRQYLEDEAERFKQQSKGDYTSEVLAWHYAKLADKIDTIIRMR